MSMAGRQPLDDFPRTDDRRWCRLPAVRSGTTALFLILVLAGACNGGSGQTVPTTATGLPTVTIPVEPATTSTTTVGDGLLEVYRRYFDAYLVLGRDPSRPLDDPSLSAVTTAAFREKVRRNLDGLRRNSIRLQGDVVLSLRSAEIAGDRATLVLCIRDDVDQYDATGMQLTPPGPGKPEVLEAALAVASGAWIVDSSRTTGEPCDV